MHRFVRQLFVDDDNKLLHLTTMVVDTVPSTSFDNNGTLSVSALALPSNKRVFFWQINWIFILLLGLGLISVTLVIIGGIWCWQHRLYRSRRRQQQHSLPLTVTDFIDTTTTKEKRSVPNPIIVKAPPVPPRPTAYTTILGSIEYRSNL